MQQSKNARGRVIDKWINATDFDSDDAPTKRFVYHKLQVRFMHLKDVRTLEER